MAVGKTVTREQQQLFGADLRRKREGKKTRTGLPETELEILAAKPVRDGKKRSLVGRGK